MGAEYEVRLHGIVSPRVLDSLCTELELRADTVLHGWIQDQSALHGLLDRLSDLGLELVDLHQTQPPNGEGRRKPV